MGDSDLALLDEWETYKDDSNQVHDDYVDWNVRHNPADSTQWDADIDALKGQVADDPNLRIENGQLQIKVDQWNYVPVNAQTIAAAQKRAM